MNPGETVPLEVFPDLIKSTALHVAARAIQLALPVPLEAKEFLDAAHQDLRTAQLTRRLTFSDVSRWEDRLLRELSQGR